MRGHHADVCMLPQLHGNLFTRISLRKRRTLISFLGKSSTSLTQVSTGRIVARPCGPWRHQGTHARALRGSNSVAQPQWRADRREERGSTSRPNSGSPKSKTRPLGSTDGVAGTRIGAAQPGGVLLQPGRYRAGQATVPGSASKRCTTASTSSPGATPSPSSKELLQGNAFKALDGRHFCAERAGWELCK